MRPTGNQSIPAGLLLVLDVPRQLDVARASGRKWPIQEWEELFLSLIELRDKDNSYSVSLSVLWVERHHFCPCPAL